MFSTRSWILTMLLSAVLALGCAMQLGSFRFVFGKGVAGTCAEGDSGEQVEVEGCGTPPPE
jgi:hypothetical protein